MVGQRSVREILLAAAPIAIAVFVFGVSFGVLAVAAHLPAWSVVLMSVLVFAGSAQFAAIGVIAAGGSVLTAIFAGGLLNLRFVATGIAVTRSLPGGRLLKSLLAQLSIDESYALSARAGSPGRPDGKTLLVTGALLYVVWIVGTSLGALLGPVLGDPKRLGLDAAFPAGFVALLWPMLSGRHAVRCAVGGVAAALVLAPFTPPGIPLAGAAVVGLWLAR
ncbi:MAG TPA: AzlC family ABC transporter permease [Candidatus Dormibacteraeota bacterium]|nr:AzlC family ABC transporter permease [Candidatus Dormibacteraeota bacterium]